MIHDASRLAHPDRMLLGSFDWTVFHDAEFGEFAAAIAPSNRIEALLVELDEVLNG